MTIKELPISFFEKVRPNPTKNSFADITPIKWTKKVLSGKKKVIAKLPKERNK